MKNFFTIKINRFWIELKKLKFSFLMALASALFFTLTHCKAKNDNVAIESSIQKILQVQEVQLTDGPFGHLLNQRQAFSPDDQFLAFDYRNDDSKIGENSSIGLVNVKTKEVKTIYQLTKQTKFGPGVGAVSFHPLKNELVFIHGLKNASEAQPYTFTRRFAMQLNLDHPDLSGPVESRDVREPFTKGASRGGSHAYSYSADGQMISFTYNDEVLDYESRINPEVHDLRTVGAFLLGEKVSIQQDQTEENFVGISFAILLAEVKANPRPGSDEISKAYEECWVGENGFKKLDGSQQKSALAYLGDVLSAEGEKLTEVFIVELPEDRSSLITTVSSGSRSALPSYPDGIVNRRLTFTASDSYPGVQGPRQWLRSSPDGKQLYFYRKNDAGIVQIYAVSPTDGAIRAITNNEFSPDTSFALSADGKYLGYGSKEAIYVTSVHDGKTKLLLAAPENTNNHLSNINWANNSYTLAYNRKVKLGGEAYFQIFTLDLSTIIN